MLEHDFISMLEDGSRSDGIGRTVVGGIDRGVLAWGLLFLLRPCALLNKVHISSSSPQITFSFSSKIFSGKKMNLPFIFGNFFK